jgi:transcriptional regulator with XRE-family HTH domain
MGAQKLVNVVLSGLARELQDIRNQRGLTLEAVCDQFKWQQSKLSRMENGLQCISGVDLGSLFAAYGVTGHERGTLIRMAERQDDPGYWEIDASPALESKTLQRLERSTKGIVDVAAWVIPELVQTADYARAFMTSVGVPAEHMAARVDARLARQLILTKDKAPKLDLIVGETALRRVIGGRDVMIEQLRGLLEIAKLPGTRLRIVPLDVSGDAGMHLAFSVMDFPHNRSVVCLQHPITNLFVEDALMVEAYRRLVVRFASVALEPAESIDLIASITREFKLAGATKNVAGARRRMKSTG